MSLLNSLLSAIDPSATPRPSASAPRQLQAAGVSPQAARPAASTNGGIQPGALKRKADGQTEGGQVKIQRKEGTAQLPQLNNSTRPASNVQIPKTKSPAPANTIPYRGTAGIGGLNTAKPSPMVARKPTVTTSNVAIPAKFTAPPPKASTTPTPGSTSKLTTAPATGAAPRPAPKKGYAAMLQRAKEREQAKAPTPPVRHEPTKILTKKEREALRAAAKGKGPSVNGQKIVANATKKVVDPKIKAQEKSKPTGYQGTARPLKRPVDVGYKGTAKPSSTAPGPAGKTSSTSMMKSKPNQQSSRFDGYANWSDLDEDMEEEGYESDDMSDMEGGIWDVEQEEQLALQAARKEDAAALAEENELKRQKEERKRKLAAMNKAAAAKRKY